MNVNDIIVEAERVDTGERVTGFVCGCKLCRTIEGLTNFNKARPIGRLTFANGEVGGIAVYTDTLAFRKTSDKSTVKNRPNIYDGCFDNSETISAMSRSELYEKLDGAWKSYREKGYNVVFVDISEGIVWEVRVVLYKGKISRSMQNYSKKFIKTENGWFRQSSAGICDKCGIYKELNTICNEGHLCGECAKKEIRAW